MSAAKHTPGPWLHDTVDGFTTINVDNRGQTGQLVTQMFDRHAPFKNASANAKLIAAAPYMAEALQTILKRAEISGDRWYADEARAALAKAGL